jgi:hypothetical protein
MTGNFGEKILDPKVLADSVDSALDAWMIQSVMVPLYDSID